MRHTPLFKAPVFKRVVPVLIAHAQSVTASLVHVTLVIAVRAVVQLPARLNLLHVRWDAAKQLWKHVQRQTAHVNVASAQTAMATPVLAMFVSV